MKPTILQRWRLAKVLVVVATLASNWWLLVPWLPGIVDPRLGLFSDLEVPGAAYSSVFRGCDLFAASLFLCALLLRGPNNGAMTRRPEFSLLVAFSVAGMMGALTPYVCAESSSLSCRQLERHLQLPPRHYLHIVAGVAEFLFITIAAWRIFQRTKTGPPQLQRAAQGVIITLTVAYPALVAVYLGDYFGAFVEPVFLLSFCAVMAMEIFEPPSGELLHRQVVASGGN